MPKNSRDSRARGDITAARESRDQDYKEKTEHLTESTEDIRTEREAIEGMEAIGTMEGMEQTMDSLREAETVSEEEFTREGEALGESQSEGKEHEGELQERSDATAADKERVGQARDTVKGDAASAAIGRAEQQADEDVEFLRGEEEQSRESREASEQDYDQLSRIVSGSGD